MSTRCHTFTGSGFDPLAPLATDVRLGDIAHHLAMMTRFGGACPVYYSVAEHAIHVAHLVEETTGDPLYALHALHHDSAEAYIGDQRRPIKSRMLVHVGCAIPFGDIEHAIFMAIVIGLKIPMLHRDHDYGRECTDTIKAADNAVLAAEFRAFFPDSPEGAALQERTPLRAQEITPRACLDWTQAREKFMGEHHRLSRFIALMQGNALMQGGSK